MSATVRRIESLVPARARAFGGKARNLAELARRYDQEAHAPLLGVRVQRMLLAPLVFLARHRRADLVAAV